MGRYYSGDIEGKFWFGIQPSDDASFFGGEELEPSCISYYFDEGDMEMIETGLRRCTEALGEYEGKLDGLFKGAVSYTDRELAEALGVDEAKLRKLLEWYARLSLGRKIHACVRDAGSCSFEADV